MALKVFEGFAGYGGGSFAFRKLMAQHPNYVFDVIGYSEIDKSASELFDLNHHQANGEPIHNFGDITTLDPNIIPDFDLFTGGFPCQPFSTAGMQMGEDDPYNRGTLFYHIMRICAVKHPRYIFLENVKGFLNKKFEPTRRLMEQMLRDAGYVADPNNPNESPLRFAVLNSKDYGIPQNRERVWMFARLGGLPQDFNVIPTPEPNELRLGDFLDPDGFVPREMYLSDAQIAHLREKHNIPSFEVNTPLCFDVYNKKIKTDGYSITLTMPEHNSVRVIEAHPGRQVVRKMSVTEQFRLMGLEGLQGVGRPIDIIFGDQSYTQLSKRAGNGWDVNVVTKVLNHIIEQLLAMGDNVFGED